MVRAVNIARVGPLAQFGADPPNLLTALVRLGLAENDPLLLPLWGLKPERERRRILKRRRLTQAKAQREQAKSQLYSAQKRVAQSHAMVTRADDVLKKFNSYAPLNGVVTNLPVRVGETVIPGLPNLPGTIIMTIADMSIITAEVKVDETDIVNVKMNQTADVTIDAIPNKTFKGHVIEIGNTAIVRSTGIAASQSTTSSQEAKDFKVVVALDAPPEDIRPGLSCTAKITTAKGKRLVIGAPVRSAGGRR
jgi:HlyD family secretion protein